MFTVNSQYCQQQGIFSILLVTISKNFVVILERIDIVSNETYMFLV